MKIENAPVEFTITQVQEDGTVTYTGTANGLVVDTDHDDMHISAWDGPFARIKTKTSITLNNLVAGTFTQKKKTGVERTARVLGWEDDEAAVRSKPTIARIREAARVAGVDEDTEYEIFYDRDFERGMRKAYIEFRWTE